MARALAKARPRAKERDFEAEFESAELLTLGIVYERQGRFADGVQLVLEKGRSLPFEEPRCQLA